MVDYRLKEVGESSFEIEWLGKKPKLNMKNLYELYKDMEFISTCGKSKQCSQFGMDLKKALKNDLGTEYDVEISIGHFYISGFVNKVGTDKYVYFRSAENNKDYRGGSNHFCNLYELDVKIKELLERG